MRRQTSPQPQPGAQFDLFHPCPKTPQWIHLPQVRSVEKSGRQHSVELRNGGIDEPNPQGRVHEGIS